MITLYTAATSNGRKISIALEELELDYKVRVLDFTCQEQKEDWFININPNGRIPAIIDHDADDLVVFESGAILIYLAKKGGRLLPADPTNHYNVLQWLFFQVGGLGPMQGQANVFYRYLDNKIPEVINRYQSETMRLYDVLEKQLSAQDYLAGEFSIADIATYPWVLLADWAGICLNDYPDIQAWVQRVGARDSVKAGMKVPADFTKEQLQALGNKLTAK